ncbi:MAG: type I methionyl aminopeptidase [Acidobacteriaceae bacterium]
MIVKDDSQIKTLKEGGAILARILNLLSEKAKPGISAFELDQIAADEAKKAGASCSFLNYKSNPSDTPYPGSLCVSINDEVVHGLPTKDKILTEGDIVGLDLGIKYKGLFTDGAVTVAIGNVEPKKLKLLESAREALYAALDVVKPGVTVGDIGHAIQTVAESKGFSPVRELVGHGVGAKVHEDPEIPCYGQPNRGPMLPLGMVIAIEPMINAKGWKVRIGADGWTIKTADGSPSSHFEHTAVVTADGCEILTVE